MCTSSGCARAAGAAGRPSCRAPSRRAAACGACADRRRRGRSACSPRAASSASRAARGRRRRRHRPRGPPCRRARARPVAVARSASVRPRATPASPISVKTEVEHEHALGRRRWRAGRVARSGRDVFLPDGGHAVRPAVRRCRSGASRCAAVPGRGLRVDDHAARELDDRERDQHARCSRPAGRAPGREVAQRDVAPPLVVGAEAGQADELDRDHDQRSSASSRRPSPGLRSIWKPTS